MKHVRREPTVTLDDNQRRHCHHRMFIRDSITLLPHETLLPTPIPLLAGADNYFEFEPDEDVSRTA